MTIKDIRYDCPECGSKMDKMHTEEELDKLYPIKSISDKRTFLKNRTDIMRFRKCSNCGHVMQLTLKQIMEGLKKVVYMSDKTFKEFKCGCGGIFKSKYTNEELQIKYPFSKYDRRFKQKRVRNKWINAKRNLVCPDCGDTKRISKKLFMKIQKLNLKRLNK